MASVNRVILVGNLGKDPEVRYMPDGASVASVSLATTDTWKDKATGEKKENTKWHRLVFFRKLAEIVGQYLKKGAQVYVSGSLRTRKWTDQGGIERYTTEIVVDEMQMLGRREAGADVDHRPSDSAPPASVPTPAPVSTPAPRLSPAPAPQPIPAPAGGHDFDDDIPFMRPVALDGLPY